MPLAMRNDAALTSSKVIVFGCFGSQKGSSGTLSGSVMFNAKSCVGPITSSAERSVFWQYSEVSAANSSLTKKSVTPEAPDDMPRIVLLFLDWFLNKLKLLNYKLPH